jgi:hypothetical protein
MNKLIKALLLLCLVGVFFSSQGQVRGRKSYGKHKEKSKVDTKDTTAAKKINWDKVTFGGSAWATFGYPTQIEIMPLVGYRVTENLQVGIGPSYVYRNYIYVLDPYNPRGFAGAEIKGNSIYGGRIYAHYNVYRNFFIRTELEELNIPFIYPGSYFGDADRTVRKWVPATLVGAGIKQEIGERSAAYFMLMYDITYDPLYSYYPSPIRMSVGFMF